LPGSRRSTARRILFQRLNLLDTRAAPIITYVAANLPIVIWLMRDYFHTIPIDLEECAAIDGASRYRIFWSIVLPLLCTVDTSHLSAYSVQPGWYHTR
jgi:ABC-type glycerol-3-phosphate transport system permease component